MKRGSRCAIVSLSELRRFGRWSAGEVLDRLEVEAPERVHHLQGKGSDMDRTRTRIDRGPEPTTPRPTLETLEQWAIMDGDCEATDGCIVEPDGRCPHGYVSWLRYLGYI